MGIHRTAARRDTNEPEIVRALEQVGATVERLSVKGCPDLLVGFRDYESGARVNLLMEVKTVKGKLTPDEEVWHEDWRGQVCIVRSIEDALRAIGRLS